MDDIDRRLLDLLQVDGRITNQDLADRVGLSPTPTLRRVHRLEREGVITGYRAVIDPHHVQLGVLASVELTLNDHTTDTITTVEDALRTHPSVVDAHMVAGDSDYVLRVRVRDLAHYEQFVVNDLRTLPHIGSIRTTFAYGAVKEAGPLTPPH